MQNNGVDCPTWDGVIIAGAAVIAALLAAATAIIRQRQQLAHDHEMRDLEDLRSMLDDIGAATALATELVANACGQNLLKGLFEGAIDRDLKTGKDNLERRVVAALQGLNVQLQRLRFRFGDEDAVTLKYAEMCQQLNKAFQTKEGVESVYDEAFLKSAQMYREFIDLCRPYVGVKSEGSA